MSRRNRADKPCDDACQDGRDRRQSRARAWLTWLVAMIVRRGRA